MLENTSPSIAINVANIAANRFGYGARNDEIALAMKDPKKWIVEQLQPITFSASFPHSNDIFFLTILA